MVTSVERATEPTCSLWIPGLLVIGLMDTGSPVLGAVGFGLVAALITPVTAIGSTLVYIGLRVRKEGYYLDTLASDMGRRDPS